MDTYGKGITKIVEIYEDSFIFCLDRYKHAEIYNPYDHNCLSIEKVELVGINTNEINLKTADDLDKVLKERTAILEKMKKQKEETMIKEEEKKKKELEKEKEDEEKLEEERKKRELEIKQREEERKKQLEEEERKKEEERRKKQMEIEAQIQQEKIDKENLIKE